MRRKRFIVKPAPTLGDFLKDSASLLLILAGLLFLHKIDHHLQSLRNEVQNMRLSTRLWLLNESLQWVIPPILTIAAVLAGLWCLIVSLTGLLRKLRRGNDRW